MWRTQDPSSTQLADLQRQIDVALDALGIDKAEVLDDPETAALGATTNTNMAQLQVSEIWFWRIAALPPRKG
eukprot:1141087-Pelagomonas_calceolata.AAC.13